MKRFLRESIADITSLGGLKIAPDGDFAAWVVSKPDVVNDCYSYELHAVRLPGGEPFRLTSGGVESTFCWLDATSLIFPSFRTNADKAAAQNGVHLTVFHRISLLGGEASEHFRVPLSNAMPLGIADGKILLSAYCDRRRTEGEFQMAHSAEKNADTGQQSKARDAFKVCDEQTYRHDALGYANKLRRRLFLYDLSCGTLTAVTSPGFNVEDVAIAANGEIVYCGAEQGCQKKLSHGIFACHAGTGGHRVIAEDTGYHIFKLLPACGKIIFWGYKAPENMGFFLEDMLSLPMDSGAVQVECLLEPAVGTLFHSDITRLSGATAHAEGDALLILLHERLQARIHRWEGGDTFAPVTPEALKVFSFDRQGDTLLCVGTETVGLQEIFAVDMRSGGFLKLTRYNDAFEYALSAPEYLAFQGRDGMEMDGFVIPPLNHVKGVRAPGILMIHGGPHVAYGDVLVCDMQALAAAGYFVFYCNPRGSGGRGRDFADINGRYGTVDYEDILRFTDKVLDVWADIDPDRLGVTGGSYGGFMTNWIITHTERFNAAVSQCSIANWFTMYFTSDVPYFVRAEMDGTPYENSDRLWRASPIRYIQDARTPTLFLQYEMDFRCPIQEAIQMYSGLLEVGVDTRLIMFEGDNHTMTTTGKPSHRIRREAEMHQWFDAYLQVK